MFSVAFFDIDILIRGAKVVDGTGNPWFYGDIAIRGERILEVAPPGRIPAEAAREVVDAAGLVVCPGFIDILSHSHIPLMQDPRDLSKITQGVTIGRSGWIFQYPFLAVHAIECVPAETNRTAPSLCGHFLRCQCACSCPGQAPNASSPTHLHGC